MFWISDRTWRKPCPACEGLSSARGEREPASKITAKLIFFNEPWEKAPHCSLETNFTHICATKSMNINKAVYYTQTITFSTSMPPPTSFRRVSTSVVQTPACHGHKYTTKPFPSLNIYKHTHKSAALKALQTQTYKYQFTTTIYSITGVHCKKICYIYRKTLLKVQ